MCSFTHACGLPRVDTHTRTHTAQVLPVVVEPSLGVDRLFLALICSAYAEDEVGGERRTYLRLPPRVAPIKAAVLPLVRNKPELVQKARGVHRQLQRRHNTFWCANTR